MVGKLHAAKDAAAEQDIVIIARTDARAVEGFQAALERCKAFEEAGADVIFPVSYTQHDPETAMDFPAIEGHGGIPRIPYNAGEIWIR